MKVWYSCKLKYAKENEEGLLKQVTEAFLLDGVSYTDAETRIYEIAQQNIAGEFAVTQITKTNISEVLPHFDQDKWFKCKVTYLASDDDAGKETKVNLYLMTCGENILQAYERVQEYMSSMLAPWEVPSITKTNIVEVFPMEEGKIESADQVDDL